MSCGTFVEITVRHVQENCFKKIDVRLLRDAEVTYYSARCLFATIKRWKTTPYWTDNN